MIGAGSRHRVIIYKSLIIRDCLYIYISVCTSRAYDKESSINILAPISYGLSKLYYQGYHKNEYKYS